ncbi:probable NOT transcription complex subunit VIP2 [Impatiens glandulifera]|uniref:probable NOT transcription complex subunit VIP2 n=1 Tax=Impatiens glandulifera TaxID=253017 RepID=UPI001FB14F8C|nr:probable NOT transcription complex subunit VIP2 [Impatiens glandulifera]XP_047310683.1 probable NOT transcription complex subunit VIP2 [Impatiens glandulifera]
MSGLLNSSLNGSATSLPDNNGRSLGTSFSPQSGAPSSVFHHTGTMQGLHNIHGNFNVPTMPGTLVSRNSSIMNNVPSSSVQQPSGSLSAARYTSNNIPVALSQMTTHGSSHGHSAVANRGGGMNVVGSPGYSSNGNGIGGSVSGILPNSTTIGNRNAVPGMGVSPMLGNNGPRITNSMGNIAVGGNIGRNMSTGGGINVPGLTSRLNLSANSGSGNLNVQGGPNRIMSSNVLQQAPQVMSMLGNSYQASGGPLSQNHVQGSLNSMGMMNDISSDGSPFDLNDFPQLTSRPGSAGGPQGQLGSLRKQGLGVSNIVQQNQEFTMQNEDFPALPGFKGGNAEYNMDLQQKEQAHDNAMSMMQSQHFPMTRSTGFNLAGTYSSHRPQQQQQPQQHLPSVTSSGVSFSSMNNQDMLHMHGSDMFQSSHAGYPSQASGAPGLGLRPLNSPNAMSGMSSYDQLIQQYQQHHNSSQFRLQQMTAATANQSYSREQGLKSMQATSSHVAASAAPDPFSLLGLLNIIRVRDPGLASLALGLDLTTLGLNLNSSENLHKTFGSPWVDEPVKGDPEFNVPQCYYAKQPPPFNSYFVKIPLDSLFYIFYSMPKDEAQLYAANELYNRGWFYHRDLRLWFTRVAKTEPLVKTNTYERGSYICFDPNSWETLRKDNFVVYYEMLEKRPALSQH